MSSESFLQPPIAGAAGERLRWHGLAGAARTLAIARAAERINGLVCVLVAQPSDAWAVEQELRFFLGHDENGIDVFAFPDWETLPWDTFSPHQDIISDRLKSLSRLPETRRGVLVVPVSTAMHRLPPHAYIASHGLHLRKGQRIDLRRFREQLVEAGYRVVDTVAEHGELAVRGSIVDLFPMGSQQPWRIDLFDDEIESLRSFDTESQLTVAQADSVEVLPARETPLDRDSVNHFLDQWHARFQVDERRCPVYQDVREGLAAPGIEYYLPLFFPALSTLFDYLPEQTTLFTLGDLGEAAARFNSEAANRYESLRHDVERPIVAPGELFLSPDQLFDSLAAWPRIEIPPFRPDHGVAPGGTGMDRAFVTAEVEGVDVDPHARTPTAALENFLLTTDHRVLFCADSAGRREMVETLLERVGVEPVRVDDWQTFLTGESTWTISVAPLESSLHATGEQLTVITEAQLFGQRARVERRSRRRQIDSDQVIRNLTELSVGAPVVHIDHGVGRYQGLQTLDIDSTPTEFLTLEYADGAKLYVPVASLHLISRYSGADGDSAPLHRLGSDQWEKARRKAAEKVRDVAAELLNVYARREAREGLELKADDTDFLRFCDQFPFDETPDQSSAIAAVIRDMQAPRPMDRLVCGDVGFGKTEVAMRAAFIAVAAGHQVAVLVPTTLLAQQHAESFRDRFADWPVRVELISRVRSEAEVADIAARLRCGEIDIVIGTHRLLSKELQFGELGLVIVDEEHRFGVRHKERLKELRAEVDILTLTATPIPRTLNMAMSGMRDMSVIATAPARRLSIKTFVQRQTNALIREAISRELRRGGQVFYLHNEVRTIDNRARELGELLPEARVAVAHGQMRPRELEGVMSDFYHRRANVLVCTTIIETGIDIPNANTIIIERADHFGLAQLHQLRGRVGRSHRQAYAYLLCPHPKSMTADATRRLEAIEAAGELGVGFTLATHDLEIRGAGELLGDGQSGHIQSIGFSLYMDMLDRAVTAIRRGETPNLDAPLEQGIEVNLHFPALIPDDYLPDVHMRLILYKRIANARDDEELDELTVEMIDRFGLLPDPIRNLFAVTRMKLQAARLGIRKLDASEGGGRIEFDSTTRVDPFALVQLVQREPHRFRLDGGTTLRLLEAPSERDARLERVTEILEFLTPDETPEVAAR